METVCDRYLDLKNDLEEILWSYRTWCFHCHRLGSIPGWGTKILQAVWYSQEDQKSDLQNINAV